MVNIFYLSKYILFGKIKMQKKFEGRKLNANTKLC